MEVISIVRRFRRAARRGLWATGFSGVVTGRDGSARRRFAGLRLVSAFLVTAGAGASIAFGAGETPVTPSDGPDAPPALSAAAAEELNAHPTLAAATNEQSNMTTTGLTVFSVQPLRLGLFGSQTEMLGLEMITEPRSLPELKRQLARAMDVEDYERALTLARVGLGIVPWDADLLLMKGLALAKLHRYEAAIAALQDALLAAGESEDLVCSLAELILISGKVSDYHGLKSRHGRLIERAYGGLLVKYFDVLEAYRTGNDDQTRAAAVKLLTALPAAGDARLHNWEFGEVRYVLGQQPASAKKEILQTVVNVLSGRMNREEGLAKVSGGTN